MYERDFDQRLQELERKAMFKKMNRDMLKKLIPYLCLVIGSILFLIELPTTGQKVAAGFYAVGSYLLVLTSFLE